VRFVTLLLIAALAFAQQRIVSTSPAITETLFALGGGERVVGVSEYCHFPPEARQRPKIGSYLKPNIETIVRLKPDLVIIERLPGPALEQLRTTGVPVEQVFYGDVATNLKTIAQIAKATNRVEAGRDLQARISTALKQVEVTAMPRQRRSVLFIVGRTPGRLDGMVAVGKGSYLNELIAMAGGRNLLADSVVAYPKVSLESIVRLKPDVIIDMGDMADTVGVTEAHKQSVEALWKGRPDIPSRVHAVASDIFVVPGPRMVDAAREFFRLIQGENR
jgi:iron complex transport system substrate-binding protein